MRTTSFALALTLLVGMGSWAYVYGVLDPYWRVQRSGASGNAYHSDFYGRWLGTRLAMRNHADPYDPSVTREIQRGIYGHPLDASSALDPHGFAYPASVVILLAPIAMLPFAVASPIFSIVLYVIVLFLMPLFMFGLGQKWDRGTVWMATFVLFASFPLAFALYVQQFTLLVTFAMAAGVACLAKRRLVLAGILFAVSTIKPQLVVLMLAWLGVWSGAQWPARRRTLISFLASAALLVFSPELLVSGWFNKWLGAANVFWRYRDLKIPAAWLLPGVFAQLATIAVLVPAVALLWRLRNAEPGEENFGFAVAVALSATLLVVPIWPALQYHHILLIPAALVIVYRIKEGSASQRALSFLALTTLGFSSAGALIVSVAVFGFRVPAERLGHLLELPLFNFSVVPLMISVALIGLLWNVVAAPGTLEND